MTAALTEHTDDLTLVANREHHLAMDAAGSMLTHAIASGEALLAKRASVPQGEWHNWLDVNFEGSRKAAREYMRWAHHRGELAGCTTTTEALQRVRGLPWVSGQQTAKGADVLERAKDRARRARKALRRQERDRAMRHVGGTVGECYSMIRRTAEAVGNATADDNSDVREALASALVDLYRAEDKIVRAVGVA